MKSAPGSAAEEMFRGEHASLNAIHDIVPFLCPASLATGVSEDGNAFLVTDFLDMSSSSSTSSSTAPSTSQKHQHSGMNLATKLATLHTTPAPIPDGYSKPQFGFPVTTCCGSTPQSNGYKSSWADFYAENRLSAILSQCEASQNVDSEFRSLVTKTVEKVVPRLLGDEHLNGGKGVMPVVIHGDLWSGNKGKGVIGGEGAVEEVVFDPSAVWGHSEYELGIMNMFVSCFSPFFLPSLFCVASMERISGKTNLFGGILVLTAIGRCTLRTWGSRLFLSHYDFRSHLGSTPTTITVQLH